MGCLIFVYSCLMVAVCIVMFIFNRRLNACCKCVKEVSSQLKEVSSQLVNSLRSLDQEMSWLCYLYADLATPKGPLFNDEYEDTSAPSLSEETPYGFGELPDLPDDFSDAESDFSPDDFSGAGFDFPPEAPEIGPGPDGDIIDPPAFDSAFGPPHVFPEPEATAESQTAEAPSATDDSPCNTD